MVLDWLWPANPWHALQITAVGAPGPSSGPAPAVPVSARSSRLMRTIGITLSLSMCRR